MRQAYVHTAVVDVDPAHEAAVGAAVTVALCGHWEHEPPCPLAPHHTATDRSADGVALRIVFATEPEREREVRERIVTALAAQQLEQASPPAVWALRSESATELTADEAALAESLVAHGSST